MPLARECGCGWCDFEIVGTVNAGRGTRLPPAQ